MKVGKQIGFHLLIWLAYLSFITSIWLNYGPFYRVLKSSALAMPIIIILVYLNFFWWIPRYLYKRKFLKFITLNLILLVLFSYVQAHWMNISRHYINGREMTPINAYRVIGEFTGFLIPLFFCIAITTLLNRNQLKEKNEALQIAKRAEELKYLKAQIGPHFLLNTLNNIYGITLDESPKASLLMLKLSNLMQFLIYETNTQTISLKKEISLIENYIELERIRYAEETSISFQTLGNLKSLFIPPLLLIPLIENAFKYGYDDQSHDCFINIILEGLKEELILKVNNSKNGRIKSDFRNGLGLDNLRKRLDLHFPKRHTLSTIDDELTYSVVLRIQNPSNPVI